jgi:hypothetical protein
MTAPPIAYDLPMRNMIAGLDATGHVTHTQHRKTHVTIHHNGGWLSHDGLLSVWRVREASAHFNIDSQGDAAQFVGVNEYAWACGDTEGNQRSISIEHCNTVGAPSWIVDEITWSRGARLAGWLFARVIGAPPTRETLVFHNSWIATLCAGPWLARMYSEILEIAQHWYEVYSGTATPTPEPKSEEDENVYQVTGAINDKNPDWLNVLLPAVKESVPLPDNGKSEAWVQLQCPQHPVDIWGVYRVFDGGSELIWGPGFDPRSEAEQIPPVKPVILLPDTYKAFKIDKKGSIGLAVLYSGPVALSGLVTLSPDGK